MSKIRTCDLYGLRRGGEIICSECLEEGELASIREDEIISREEIESASATEIICCDRCGIRIFSPRLLQEGVEKIEKPLFERGYKPSFEDE